MGVVKACGQQLAHVASPLIPRQILLGARCRCRYAGENARTTYRWQQHSAPCTKSAITAHSCDLATTESQTSEEAVGFLETLRRRSEERVNSQFCIFAPRLSGLLIEELMIVFPSCPSDRPCCRLHDTRSASQGKTWACLQYTMHPHATRRRTTTHSNVSRRSCGWQQPRAAKPYWHLFTRRASEASAQLPKIAHICAAAKFCSPASFHNRHLEMKKWEGYWNRFAQFISIWHLGGF